MRIWHPEVHALFGEKLHYYLVTVRPFDSNDFKNKIEKFKNEKAIGGFCYYEVFGAFDAVLRVWIAKNAEDQFVDDLRKFVPEIEKAIPFRVTEISSYWCREIDLENYSDTALNQVTVDRVKEIQNGNKSKEGEEFKNNGLLTEIFPSNNVKFFISLSNPQPVARNVEDRFRKSLEEIINSYTAPANQLSRVSIYFGYGFAWALIKAETPVENYFLIGKIINDLNQKLYGFFTTTYLATGTNHYETDDISNFSLTAASGYDLNVARLLPQFYSTEMSADLRTSIIQWVQNHSEVDKLKEYQRALISRALSGIVAQNEKAVFAAFQDFFVDQERLLRKNWPIFLAVRAGQNKTGEILREAGIQKEANAKHFALGDMCNICSKIIKNYRLSQDEDELTTGWQDVAKLRNDVAHGACEPLKVWPEMLSVLLASFPKLDHLETVITASVAAKAPVQV